MPQTQQVDTELITKITQLQDTIMDAFNGVKPACEASIELARKNQIPNLESECVGALEGAEAVLKQANDLNDSLTALVTYYKKLDEALGN